MTKIQTFTRIFQFLLVIPATLLCYLPMKNHLRFRLSKIIACILGLMIILAPICTCVAAYFSLNITHLFIFLMPLVFPLYHASLKISFCKSLTVFYSVCALIAFPSNFSYLFDAWLRPTGHAIDFSLYACLFQLASTYALTALTAYPVYRWGRRMVDNVDLNRVWYMYLPIPLTFLFFNLIMIPYHYETIHTNNMFPIYLIMLIAMLSLMLFIHNLFYHIAMTILTSAKDQERIRFFEMQESQYLSLKNYINQTEKMRHDFRQSVYAIKQMTASQDYLALENYLLEYEKTLPQKETIFWCENTPVNALLNHYAHIAGQYNIHLKWDISLPSSLSIAEPDLCSLLGNILENAIDGCRTEKIQKRYIRLSITIQNTRNLYIVSINNFNGLIKTKGSRYLSSKRNGSGTGIPSIKMTAEKYGGIARFSHHQHEFSVDIMMYL